MVGSLARARRNRRSTSPRLRGRVARNRAAISRVASAPGGSVSLPVRRRRIDAELLRLADALDSDLDGRHLAANLVLDLGGDLLVGLQEVARVLSSLSEPRLTIVEPRSGLGQDASCNAHVEQPAFAADALVVHDVELGDAEG